MKSELRIYLYDDFREIDYDNRTKATIVIFIAIVCSYGLLFILYNILIYYFIIFLMILYISFLVLQGKSYREFSAKSFGCLNINDDGIMLNNKIVPWLQFKIENLVISDYKGKVLRPFYDLLGHFDIDVLKAAKSNGINRNEIRIRIYDNIFEYNYLIESKEHLQQIKDYITLLTSKEVLSKVQASKILRESFNYKYAEIQRFYDQVDSKKTKSAL